MVVMAVMLKVVDPLWTKFTTGTLIVVPMIKVNDAKCFEIL